ncbi:MAG: hypothetical protein ACKV22_22265 [Bryobacteraceae bacterium]
MAARGKSGHSLPSNRRFGSILNNDINNILIACSGARTTRAEYAKAVEALLLGKPGVLAQNVGMPDPVIYKTAVATTFDKHIVEATRQTWPTSKPSGAEAQAGVMAALFSAGTDPLRITVEVCRKHGVPIVASYRMNAEDWYKNTWRLSDFGRAHPDARIPGTGALDPANPIVFEHRRSLFREAADNYDIDGIEFDYMRWTHMISDPHRNHEILTREVRETRRMLDEVAGRKRRRKLLLGVRVGYSLDGPPAGKSDFSCKDLGLDVRTWIAENLIDYICPSYFWGYVPSMPKTREFVDLAKGHDAGIYPTVFPYAQWQADPARTRIDPADTVAMKRLRDDILKDALQGYADGADGISTFNWVHHHQPGMVTEPMRDDWGLGSKKVQMAVHPLLRNPRKLKAALTKDSPDRI